MTYRGRWEWKPAPIPEWRGAQAFRREGQPSLGARRRRSAHSGYGFVTLSRAGNGAACPDGRNEDIDLAVRIVPDFFGRRRPVNGRIGRLSNC